MGQIHPFFPFKSNLKGLANQMFHVGENCIVGRRIGELDAKFPFLLSVNPKTHHPQWGIVAHRKMQVWMGNLDGSG